MNGPSADTTTHENGWRSLIPAHWRVGSLRHFTSFTTGWTPPTGDDDAYSGDLPWANISDLGPRWLPDTAKHVSAKATAGQTPAEPGDLLFSFKLSVGATSRATVRMYTNEAIAVFADSPALCTEFAYYALPVFVPMNANTNIYGAKLLNRSLINSAPMAAPPIEEQRAIADFLDRETAQIDTLIAKQEQLIEKLVERREAVIESTVTRPQGTSQPVKLARSFTFHNGDRGSLYPSRDEFVPEGVPFINAGHLVRGRVDFSNMNYITPEKYDALGGAKLQEGDLLFCLRGSLGKFGVFPASSAAGALASSLVALRKMDPLLDLRFVTYLFSTRLMSDLVSLSQTGSAQPNLSADQVAQFRFDVPLLSEQLRIAAYLDEQTAKIDTLIAKADEFIALSKERRSALITAAVTGQIDVRNKAA